MRVGGATSTEVVGVSVEEDPLSAKAQRYSAEGVRGDRLSGPGSLFPFRATTPTAFERYGALFSIRALGSIIHWDRDVVRRIGRNLAKNNREAEGLRQVRSNTRIYQGRVQR